MTRLSRLRTPSPYRRRAQLAGVVGLCVLATGSMAALLAVGRAGVEVGAVRPSASSPSPSTVAGAGPVYGWATEVARVPYPADAWSSASPAPDTPGSAVPTLARYMP